MEVSFLKDGWRPLAHARLPSSWNEPRARLAPRPQLGWQRPLPGMGGGGGGGGRTGLRVFDIKHKGVDSGA